DAVEWEQGKPVDLWRKFALQQATDWFDQRKITEPWAADRVVPKDEEDRAQRVRDYRSAREFLQASAKREKDDIRSKRRARGVPLLLLALLPFAAVFAWAIRYRIKGPDQLVAADRT